MKTNSLTRSLVILFIPAVFGCAPPPGNEGAAESEPGETQIPPAPFQDAMTFHASFDNGPDADFARGDNRIYTAPSFDERDKAEPGIGNPAVEIVAAAGRFGSALRFNTKNTHAIFYEAEDNVAYSAQDWSGTVSFWLSLTPGEDLAPGYCDPIQITDTRYSDAAVWVDFTRENPRLFRLGVFGDLEAWNPGDIDSDHNPDFMKRLVVVHEPPFQRDQWTHVVITFSGLGSESGGTAKLYLNGERQGTSSDIQEPFTWDVTRAQIRVGVNYVGMFDELALFDRPLSDEEIKILMGAGVKR